MPAYIVGDIFRVAMYSRWNQTQNQVNVQYYKVRAINGTSPSDFNLIPAMSSWAAAIYRPLLPTICTFDGVKAGRVTVPPMQPTTTTEGAGVGQKVGDALAPQLSVLIKIMPGGGVPSRTHGRLYFPSGTEVDEGTDGRPTFAALQAYVAAGYSLLTMTNLVGGAATTATLDHVIRRKVAGAYVYFLSTTISARSSFATQRRRSAINRGDMPLA
jgi:hypothetical protein